MNFVIITAIVAASLVAGRQIEQCELVRELYETHVIPRNEIYKHLCITTGLTHHNANGEYLGLYRIGTQWWCDEKKPGGGCNVKCSDLLDDDITDDVKCATKILESHGTNAWVKNDQFCMKNYHHKAEECLRGFETTASFTYDNESTIDYETSNSPLTSVEQDSSATMDYDPSHDWDLLDENESSTHSAALTPEVGHIECSCLSQNLLIGVLLLLLSVSLGAVFFVYRMYQFKMSDDGILLT